MSEYTPTTENVRQTFAYVQAGLDHDDGHPFVTHIHVEEFDRWLAEVERAAAEKAWADGFRTGDGVGAYSNAQIAELNPHQKTV